jgi:hypothetical protein
MVYLLLAFAGIYSLLWLIGLALAVRSTERNLAIPAIGLLGFLGLTGFAGMKTTEAMDNPHKLTAEKYNQLKEGMTPDEVKALFGEPSPIDEKYELTTYHIGMPKGLNRSLSMDQRHIDRVEASIKVKISGEPSKAQLGRRDEGLGAPANAERNGLTGASIKLVENGNETIITEGEHWTYEDDDTPEIVAKKIAEAIEATEAWSAVGSTDEEPQMLTITPKLEANFGTACNDTCTVQVLPATEPEPVAEGEEEKPLDVTGAIIIRSKTDGKPQEFRGGSEEAYVWIWDEDGRVLDTDFSNEDRIVVVGFDKHKVISSVQAGLGIAPTPAAAEDGGEG